MMFVGLIPIYKKGILGFTSLPLITRLISFALPFPNCHAELVEASFRMSYLHFLSSSFERRVLECSVCNTYWSLLLNYSTCP